MEELNVKIMNNTELEKAYEYILDLQPSNFIINKKTVTTNGVLSSKYYINQNDYDSGERVIINKCRNLVTEEDRIRKDGIVTFTIDEEFILNKDIIYFTTYIEALLLSSSKTQLATIDKKIHIVNIIIRTSNNKVIHLEYNTKEVMNKLIKDALKPTAILKGGSNVLRKNFKQDIELALESFYLSGGVEIETIISKAGKTTKRRNNKIPYLDLYLDINNNKTSTIAIDSKMLKEFEDKLNGEFNNLAIKIKKIIRITEKEWEELTDEDKLIYNNIEKHLQVLESKGVKFDSVMATIKYIEEIERKIINKRTSNAIRGARDTLNTFKLHYIITGDNYNRKHQCEHERCGHYRHYKNGKVIYIDKYKAGKQIQQ